MQAEAASLSSPPLKQAIAELTAQYDLRVWSVIVSIFGDLAQGKDDQISGALLSALTGLMGIRAEAKRVALHRLRKDGWLESRKSGRSSNYRLTTLGAAESLAARGRIYANEMAPDCLWHIHIPDPDKPTIGLVSMGYISIVPGVFMGKGLVSKAPGGGLSFQGDRTSLPNWLTEKLALTSLNDAYTNLTASLLKVERILSSAPAATPVERAVLRVLIVHNWRRLVLRDPELPQAFYPADWKAEACRSTVSRLLARLIRLSLSDLHKSI